MRYCILLLLTCCAAQKVAIIKENRQAVSERLTYEENVIQNESKNSLNLMPPIVNKVWHSGTNDSNNGENYGVSLKNLKTYTLKNPAHSCNMIAFDKNLYIFDEGKIATFNLTKNSWTDSISLQWDSNPRIVFMGYNNGKIGITTSEGHVCVYDTYSKKFLFRSQIKHLIRSAPVLDESSIYVQTADNRLYCYNQLTGAEIWSHEGNFEWTMLESGSKLALSGDKLVITYTSGEVTVLNKKTGAVVWTDIALPQTDQTELPDISANPVIDSNKIYVLSYSKIFSVYNLDNGHLRWRKNIGGEQTPLVFGNYVYVLNQNKQIIAFNKSSGNIRWKIPVQGNGFSNLLLVNNLLVIASDDGIIYLLEPSSGCIKQKLDTKQKSWPQELLAFEGRLILLTKDKLNIWG